MCACRLRLPAYALSALLPALLVAGAFAGARPAAAAATSAIAQVASVARPVTPRASGVRGFRASLRAPAPGRAANTFVWDVDAPRGVSARVMSVALSGCWGTAQVARAVARAASGSSVAVASRGGAVTVAGRHGAALTLPAGDRRRVQGAVDGRDGRRPHGYRDGQAPRRRDCSDRGRAVLRLPRRIVLRAGVSPAPDRRAGDQLRRRGRRALRGRHGLPRWQPRRHGARGQRGGRDQSRPACGLSERALRPHL